MHETQDKRFFFDSRGPKKIPDLPLQPCYPQKSHTQNRVKYSTFNYADFSGKSGSSGVFNSFVSSNTNKSVVHSYEAYSYSGGSGSSGT